MKIHQYYLDLRLTTNSTESQSVLSYSINDLSEVFFCSTKQTKRILQQFEKNKWIIWIRGHGRGNVSTIYFEESLLEWLKQFFIYLHEQENIAVMLDIINQDLPPIYYDELVTYLLPHLGIHRDRFSKDVMRVMLSRPFSSLDPALVSITTESHFVTQIYDTLVEWNKDTFMITPSLAHDWEHDDDYSEWTFYLRKSVHFHHGKQLTSKDVSYSLNRLKESEACQWAVSNLQSIDDNEPYIIRIKFSKSTPWFLHFLATANCSILPNDIHDHKQLIGSGAFKVKSHSEKGIILEAFANYFRERALLDCIECYIAPKQYSHKRKLFIGDKENSEMTKLETIDAGCMYAMLQIKEGSPLEKKSFREALFHCLDGQKLVEELKGVRYIPSSSFLPEFSKNNIQVKSIEKAKYALNTSQYKGQTILIYHLDHIRSKEDAIWFQKRCAQIGIVTELRSFSLQNYYDENMGIDGDIIMMGEVFSDNEFLSFVSLFHNKTCFVRKYLQKSQLEQLQPLIERYIVTKGKENRRKIHNDIEQMMRDDYWILFNYHVKTKTQIPVLFGGVQMQSFFWPDFRKLWIKDKVK